MKSALHSTSAHQSISDETLIDRFVQQGEEAAMNELYRRYAHLVMGVCLKYLKHVNDAQDATQQIFLKLLDDLARFQVQSFRAWIHQVARNHCLMILRKGNNTVYDEHFTFLDVENEAYPHHKWELEQNLQHLEAAMEKLNAEQKNCLHLFYFEKKNYAEIASIQNMTLMKVKSAIQNGKRNLKIMLTRTNGTS